MGGMSAEIINCGDVGSERTESQFQIQESWLTEGQFKTWCVGKL